MSKKKLKRTIDEQMVKQKKLKKAVATLKGQLTKAEQKLTKEAERTERWKKEAKAHKKSAAKSGARADLMQEQLDQAAATLEPVPSEATVQAVSLDTSDTGKETGDGVGVPDENWSVVQLRAEARARGIAGMSKKPKAELLSALT